LEGIELKISKANKNGDKEGVKLQLLGIKFDCNLMKGRDKMNLTVSELRFDILS